MSKFRIGHVLGAFSIYECNCLCEVKAEEIIYARESYPKDLWKGLIAEAVGEGYDGMYAVCCVYRNRLEKGMSLGCVGLKRKDLDEFVKRQGKKYEYMAKEIIEEVFFNRNIDVTKGATHYENIEVFGVPYWVKNMEITTKIGDHTFYK